MEAIGGLAVFLMGIFFLFLLILWVVLPFLIMGTNNRLSRIIDLLEKNNAIQHAIRDDMKHVEDDAEKPVNI